MRQRLSWNQVKKLYEGQWVELVDFEWDWNNAYPRWACVGLSADSREELLSLSTNDESLILFIGAAECMVRQDESRVSL